MLPHSLVFGYGLSLGKSCYLEEGNFAQPNNSKISWLGAEGYLQEAIPVAWRMKPKILQVVPCMLRRVKGKNKYISDLIYTYKHMCIYIHTYIYYVNIDISFSRSLIISAICQWKWVNCGQFFSRMWNPHMSHFENGMHTWEKTSWHLIIFKW